MLLFDRVACQTNRFSFRPFRTTTASIARKKTERAGYARFCLSKPAPRVVLKSPTIRTLVCQVAGDKA